MGPCGLGRTLHFTYKTQTSSSRSLTVLGVLLFATERHIEEVGQSGASEHCVYECESIARADGSCVD